MAKRPTLDEMISDFRRDYPDEPIPKSLMDLKAQQDAFLAKQNHVEEQNKKEFKDLKIISNLKKNKKGKIPISQYEIGKLGREKPVKTTEGLPENDIRNLPGALERRKVEQEEGLSIGQYFNKGKEAYKNAQGFVNKGIVKGLQNKGQQIKGKIADQIPDKYPFNALAADAYEGLKETRPKQVAKRLAAELTPAGKTLARAGQGLAYTNNKDLGFSENPETDQDYLLSGGRVSNRGATATPTAKPSVDAQGNVVVNGRVVGKAKYEGEYTDPNTGLKFTVGAPDFEEETTITPATSNTGTPFEGTNPAAPKKRTVGNLSHVGIGSGYKLLSSASLYNKPSGQTAPSNKSPLFGNTSYLYSGAQGTVGYGDQQPVEREYEITPQGQYQTPEGELPPTPPSGMGYGGQPPREPRKDSFGGLSVFGEVFGGNRGAYASATQQLVNKSSANANANALTSGTFGNLSYVGTQPVTNRQPFEAPDDSVSSDIISQLTSGVIGGTQRRAVTPSPAPAMQNQSGYTTFTKPYGKNRVIRVSVPTKDIQIIDNNKYPGIKKGKTMKQPKQPRNPAAPGIPPIPTNVRAQFPAIRAQLAQLDDNSLWVYLLNLRSQQLAQQQQAAQRPMPTYAQPRPKSNFSGLSSGMFNWR